MSFLERVTWDREEGVHVNTGMRYMIIKPEALMGFVHELPAQMRPSPLTPWPGMSRFMAGNPLEPIKTWGRRKARRCCPSSSRRRQNWAGASGGLSAGQGKSGYRSKILPFADGYGPAGFIVCEPILGMLTAVGALVLGGPVTVREVECAAMRSSKCEFIVELSV